MLCWIFQANNSVHAQELHHSSFQPVNLKVEAQKFLDKTALMTLDQIMAFSDEQWQPVKDQITGYHFWEADYWAATKGAVLWLKIQLPGVDNLDKVWLELLPNVGINGKIAVFDQDSWVWQEPVKHAALGEIYQPAKYLTFLLDKSRSHQTAYIRLTTEQTFQFSLKARSLDELPWYFMSNNLFFGLVAGMLLLAMIYNFAIGLNAKEQKTIAHLPLSEKDLPSGRLLLGQMKGRALPVASSKFGQQLVAALAHWPDRQAGHAA